MSNKTCEKKGAACEVTLCKKIPEIISSPVLFFNAGYGIQSIRAPGLELELISYKKIKEDERLKNYKEFFNQRPVSEEVYDFFEKY
jgi:hypothetical protein